MIINVLYSLLFVRSSAFMPSEIPSYCAHHITKANRGIPTLNSNESSLVSELAQVQVLMRHGARTPYTSLACWQGYDIQWTGCRVHTLEAPSIASEKDYSFSPSPIQFRKMYDDGVNLLPGTCQVGQLLYEGLIECIIYYCLHYRIVIHRL